MDNDTIIGILYVVIVGLIFLLSYIPFIRSPWLYSDYESEYNLRKELYSVAKKQLIYKIQKLNDKVNKKIKKIEDLKCQYTYYRGEEIKYLKKIKDYIEKEEKYEN